MVARAAVRAAVARAAMRLAVVRAVVAKPHHPNIIHSRESASSIADGKLALMWFTPVKKRRG